MIKVCSSLLFVLPLFLLAFCVEESIATYRKRSYGRKYYHYRRPTCYHSSKSKPVCAPAPTPEPGADLAKPTPAPVPPPPLPLNETFPGDCPILLASLPAQTLPDCYQANATGLPLFSGWEWLTPIDNIIMGSYDPPIPVVMEGNYSFANNATLWHNIRMITIPSKETLIIKVALYTNVSPAPNGKNVTVDPHIEESIGKVDNFGTRYTHDSDCCPTNVPPGAYYIRALVNYTSPNDNSARLACEARICYYLYEEKSAI